MYDPTKKYTWTPQDTFTLTGDQFGTVLNAIRAIVGTPETQRILAIARANDVFETLMIQAVEDGIVLEMPEPGKESHLKVVQK